MGGEMTAAREVDRVLARFPFNSGSNEGARNVSLRLHLGF
jgi:hypothetical protein